MQQEKAAPAGLSAEEVAQRRADGRDNRDTGVSSKSYAQILRRNICTLFNALNLALAVVVLLFGAPRNALFIFIILTNVLIGTVQEIRAKKIIDELSLVTAPHAEVLRDGVVSKVPVEEVVLDDVLLLRRGTQVCADAQLLSGACELDESMLTGEADPVGKREGDELLSGSFVVSGSCCARVCRVGAAAYAARIAHEAQKSRPARSQIMQAFNKIIRTVSVIILPLGALLFAKQYLLWHQPISEAVTATVAAMIGMIPEGLILLTSVVLAVGVVRLSRHQTLVRDLESIETLARVDTLCLDKTGTITAGHMRLCEIVPLDPAAEKGELLAVLAQIAAADEDENPTTAAIAVACPPQGHWKAEERVEFSSARKWQAVHFAEKGAYALGAPDWLSAAWARENAAAIAAQTAQGRRVLLLCGVEGEIPLAQAAGSEALRPLALVVLEDVIREEAPDTLRFFAEQGVEIKLVSGDDPQTVAAIAARAGLADAKAVDLTGLSAEEIREIAGEYNVFGRVDPAQKRELVCALQEQGHIVGMTGDGVNDVLALRRADCSIAMAAGSDAARCVSQLVLLENDFSALYPVVMEGRRSINNIQRSASLFLVKTMFSALLAILFLFLPFAYPFYPIQLTLISTLTIGIPSFFLALEPNRERVRGDFLPNILQRAVPGALSVVCNVVIICALSGLGHFSQEQISTLAVLTTGGVGMLNLLRVCLPLNWRRGVMLVLLAAAFTGAVLLLEGLFFLVPRTGGMYAVLAGLLLLSALMIWGMGAACERLFAGRQKARKQGRTT